MEMQSLMKGDGRVCDMLRCKDGTLLWFDISDALRTLQHRMPDGLKSLGGQGTESLPGSDLIIDN